MVEQRRQLNNMLSKSKVSLLRGFRHPRWLTIRPLQLAESPRETVNGRRVRDPQCARCRQHGFRVPLRGHKRVLCQFATCKCEMVSTCASLLFELVALVLLRLIVVFLPTFTEQLTLIGLTSHSISVNFGCCDVAPLVSVYRKAYGSGLSQNPIDTIQCGFSSPWPGSLSSCDE